MVSAPLKNQNGIGVIGILVTVIIFLVILTGVFAIVGRTTEAGKLQQAQQDIMAIQQATRQTYATSKNYAGLDKATAIKAGILTDSMQNPWGGTIEVKEDQFNTQNFVIVYDQVPPAACIQLASGMQNAGWKEYGGVMVNNDFVDTSDNVVLLAGQRCVLTDNTLEFYGR